MPGPFPPFPPATWEIKSPRLVIRTALPSDAEALYDMSTKPGNSYGEELPDYSAMSVEKKRATIENWRVLQAKGQCAWLVIALRDELGGQVMGTHGFNCFRPRAAVRDEGGPDDESVVEPGPAEVEGRYLTDLGITIDHEHWRKGYATEAFAMSAEHAFGQLGCQVVRVETGVNNVPWRTFMHALGLDGEVQGKAGWGDGSEDAYMWKIDQEAWGKVRDDLKAKGKWPL